MSSNKDYLKRYYQANKEEIKARSREWHSNNIDKTSISHAEYYQRNRDRLLAKQKQYYTSHREEHKLIARKCHLKTSFGLTLEDFSSMLANQGGVCAICKSTDHGGKDWNVDHDHSCCPGKKSCGRCIRGLLCSWCNQAIGLMRDNPTTLESASYYLRKYASEKAEFESGK